MSQESDLHPQTIDQVTTLLSEWAKETTHGASVSLAPPEAEPPALDVNVYLLDVTRKPSLRGPRRPPLQVWLRYLVSAWGPEPAAAHHALHQLVFAALDKPDLEVGETPVPAQLWSALGAVPRPAFVLRYPLRVEQYELGAPLVREVRLVQHVSSTTVHGRLLMPVPGPDGKPMPLAAARVEVLGSRRSVTTDRSGYFRLEHVRPGAVPSGAAIHLRVHARGYTFEIVAHETGSAGAPVEIEVPLPTGRLECRLEDSSGEPLAGVRIELPDRRQYLKTRKQGQFVLDGLPDGFPPDQVIASQAGERLDTHLKNEVVVLTSLDGASGEPVVIRLEA